MSSQLCAERTSSEQRTFSFNGPNPYLVSIKELTDWPFSVGRYYVQASEAKLRAIAELPDDWDGSGSLKPRLPSIANASAHLQEVCRIALLFGDWKAPHISCSEFGDVTFEWWNEEKKLTIYFGDDHLEIIRVWGPNINDQMHSYITRTSESLIEDWAWLNGD